MTDINLLGRSLKTTNDLLVSAVNFLTGLPRWAKRVVVFLVDWLLLAISTWMAFFLRLGEWIPADYRMGLYLLCGTLAVAPVFALAGVYHAIFRYAGMGVMRTLARAFLIYSAAMIAIFMVYSVDGIPRTVAIIQPIMFFMMLVMTRILFRYLLIDLVGRSLFGGVTKVVLIYGAGRLGQQIAMSLRGDFGMRVVGYLDDDVRLRGQKLDGHRVHLISEVERVIAREGVTDIVLALPNISRRRRSEIVSDLGKLRVKVSTLPPAGEILGGNVSVTDIRPLEIEDLLGRQPVQANQLLMARTIRGKSVLVTGAGGSIGSELCRQILANEPRRLVLFEISEPALYQIERELDAEMNGAGAAICEVVPVLGSVVEGEKVFDTLTEFEVDTVYHAAAYKHVPLVEANPIAAIRNNVLGTYKVAQAASQRGISDMILISTDKAVRPTNVMGATKRAAEQILQGMASGKSTPRFSMVRFGNVLGSSGSVVPLFRKQIVEGGPITVTHRDIMRFFMTIPEAASLVIQAGGLARGGEVFVLDMGEPVKIYELARTMVNLSGMEVRDGVNPDGDIEIVEVGLRTGEKLFEELLIGGDPKSTAHPQIMMAREGHLSKAVITELVEKIASLRSPAEAIALLGLFVPEFHHMRDNDGQQSAALS